MRMSRVVDRVQVQMPLKLVRHFLNKYRIKQLIGCRRKCSVERGADSMEKYMSVEKIVIGIQSDVGKECELNEDSFGTPTIFNIDRKQQEERGTLVAVADGMGGHAAGAGCQQKWQSRPCSNLLHRRGMGSG